MGKKDRKVNSASSKANVQTCSGNFPSDFEDVWTEVYPEKCGLPQIKPRAKVPVKPLELSFEENTDCTAEDEVEELPTTYTTISNGLYNYPSIDCEFEVEETKASSTSYAKEVFIHGWRVQKRVLEIFSQCVLDRMTTLNLWNTGMDESCIQLLAALLKRFPTIKNLIVEGNPLSDCEQFHLLCQNSTLTSLSLRNNKITDKGAVRIAKNLGDVDQPCPVILNLSFNRIGDEGAKALAKALRYNRSLLSLSVACNNIGDEGCAALASSLLNTIKLTHEEIVERRRIVAARSMRSIEPRDSGKAGSNKSAPSVGGKSAGRVSNKNKGKGKDKKGPDSRNGKSSVKGRLSIKDSGGRTSKSLLSETDSVELKEEESSHPFLHPKTELKNGSVFIPGCLSLVHLNLSRNKIGVRGLKSLYAAAQGQMESNVLSKRGKGLDTNPGLIRVLLQNNDFDENEVEYVKLMEALASRDPLAPADLHNKSGSCELAGGSYLMSASC